MDACLNKDEGKALAKKIASESDVKLHECYQCGKCTAGCPMAHAMDVMPRQVVRMLQLGMSEELMKSRTIWICAACHTCVERCPHEIDIPTLIERTRYEAKKQKFCAVSEVNVFTEAFLANVELFGKSQEVILEGLYNTLTRNFLQDMNNVPRMVLNGLIKPELHTVKEKGSVRKIIDAARKEDER